MHNIIKFQAWADSHVNFLYHERGPLVAIDPLVSEIFMFESLNTRTDTCTDERTHGWTPARPVYYKGGGVGSGGGGLGGGGVRVDVNEELKFWENSQKKIGGGGCSCWGGSRVDVNEELKFK